MGFNALIGCDIKARLIFIFSLDLCLNCNNLVMDFKWLLGSQYVLISIYVLVM